MEVTTNLNEIAAEKAYPELTEPQKQELDNRIKDHEINPDNTMTWEEIKASIKK
jgi:putative addiction module component (TIGR02574 family)